MAQTSDDETIQISGEGLLSRKCSFCDATWVYSPGNEMGAAAYGMGHTATNHPVELSVMIESDVADVEAECDAYVKEHGFIEVVTEPDAQDRQRILVLRNG